MLLHVIESDIACDNKPIYKLNNTTTLLIPAIVLNLILNGYENIALKLIQNAILTIDNVVHNLEILMHQVLVNDYTTETLSSENVIDIVVKFIMNFPEYLEIFCYCTRKIEMKLWPKLFAVVGSPEKLFVECIERKKFDVASAYLVVINNVESVSVNKKLYNMLLLELINHKKWKLLRDVFNYLRNTCANIDNTSPRSRAASFHVSYTPKTNEFIRNRFFDACTTTTTNDDNLPSVVGSSNPKMVLHLSFDDNDDIHDIDFFHGIIFGKADTFLANHDILNLSYMLQASYINIKCYIEKKRDKFEELVSTSKKAYGTLDKLVQIFAEFIQYFESRHQNTNVINSIFSEKTYKSQRSQIKALHGIFCECQLYKWATLFTILDYENAAVLNQTLASLKEHTFKTTPQQNFVDVVETIIITIDQLLQLGDVLSYRSRLWNNALSLKVNFIPKSLSYHTSTGVSEELDSLMLHQSSGGGLLTANTIHDSLPIFEHDENSDNLNFSTNIHSANLLLEVDEQIHADDNSLTGGGPSSIANSNIGQKSSTSTTSTTTTAAAAIVVPDDSQGRCRIS